MGGYGGGFRRTGRSVFSDRSTDASDGVWPAFVDALSALLTILLFSLMIFVVAYVYLGASLKNRDERAKHLASDKARLEQRVDQASRAQNLSQQEIQDLRRIIKALQDQKALEVDALQRQTQQALTDQATKQEEVRALKDQLAALLSLRADEARAARSEFFGQLKKALQGRTDVRMVGDRFIMQSEVLFDSGSADLSAQGKKAVATLAAALVQVMASIPESVPWVLRVDGHTDKAALRPGARFATNLDLSLARASSVAALLIQSGLPPQRIAVAGFGQFRSLSQGQSSARDRRIELVFDQGY
jgi:chemotaxis protein MotB